MKKYTLSLLILFISTALFSQTGETKGWPSKDRYDFITECLKTSRTYLSSDTSRFYCYCMQEKVEAKYPNVADANTLTAEELAKPEWQKEIKACLYGFWGRKDREEFLTSCIDAAKKGMTEEKAKNYCECMLFKVEVKFPSVTALEGISEDEMQKPDWQKLIKECLKF